MLLADPMFLQRYDVTSLEQLPTKYVYLMQYIYSVTVISVGLFAFVFNWNTAYLSLQTFVREF